MREIFMIVIVPHFSVYVYLLKIMRYFTLFRFFALSTSISPSYRSFSATHKLNKLPSSNRREEENQIFRQESLSVSHRIFCTNKKENFAAINIQGDC